MRILRIVGCVISAALLLACTKHNPKSCCTSPVECQAAGLDQLTPCPGLEVCGTNGECTAPQCGSAADCTGSNDLCENQMCVAQTCLGAEHWSACFVAIPSGDLVVPTQIDTSPSSADCAPAPPEWLGAGQPDTCFVIGEHVIISSPVVAGGTRPLAVFASGSIEIQTGAGLSVASMTRSGVRGPGSPSDSCKTAQQAPNTSTNGIGGGGAGGSFVYFGGPGGVADMGAAQNGIPAAGDSVGPLKLRAGCDGQRGADGTSPTAAPGAGGGAVYLAAGETINIAGYVNASGGGGNTAGLHSGGSGGGTGGMIVMYAPAIVASGAFIVAGGGGGAGGGGAGSPGQDGYEVDSADPTFAASGGMTPGGCPSGGDGYGGGRLLGGGVNSATGTCGGAGGGGGAGYVRTNVTLDGATVSPPADVVP